MNIITKKVTLIPAPILFVGSRLTVRVEGDALDFGIFESRPPAGSDKTTVQWGDGETTTVEGAISQLVHTYAMPGTYQVRISDDAESLTLIGSTSPEEYQARYAPRILAFESNATKLMTIGTGCFRECANLVRVTFDCSKAELIGLRAFAGCRSLAGVVSLPVFHILRGLKSAQPFEGCTGGITEIHFSASAEDDITSSSVYKGDQTLGTGTAVCKFDL